MHLVQENEKRTQTEAALHEAFLLLETHHRNLLSVLNQLHIGTVIVDANGSIVFLNETIQHLFQQQNSAILGRHWENAFPLHEPDKAKILEMLKLPCKNRTKIPIQLYTSPRGSTPTRVDIVVRDNPSHPHQHIFYVYDTTEINQLRHLLKHAVQVKDLVGKSPPMKRIY